MTSLFFHGVLHANYWKGLVDSWLDERQGQNIWGLGPHKVGVYIATWTCVGHVRLSQSVFSMQPDSLLAIMFCFNQSAARAYLSSTGGGLATK